jgi:L-ascorbate metabolism protein UlaG (beta-lactamase superfamily)
MGARARHGRAGNAARQSGRCRKIIRLSIEMRLYRGPVTDHFDGEHFYNPASQVPHGSGGLLKWLANREQGPWREWTDAPPGPPPPARVSDGGLRVTFIGHSTVLIQMDGMNFLTDPIWSMRASPFTWIGPRRHRPPGLRLEHLPPIDIVLQSHDHYDHLDIPTLRRLTARHRLKFLVPLGVRARLTARKIPGGAEAAELDWWQSISVSEEIKITVVPARHFSGRSLRDRNRTLWCGYMIEGPSGAVFFAGDTGFGTHFSEIRERFPKIRLALLPIGAFRPQWFMGPVHMSPQDAVCAHQELRAASSMATHFGTFSLADDGEEEPVTELQRALQAAGIPASRFITLDCGQGMEIP